MKKAVYIGFSIALLASVAKAQSQIDVLRYSQTTIGGTARSLSMGGAFGAVGADFSTLSSNPGGIGVFKHSEMSFSPTFYGQSSSSNFVGNAADNSKYNFYFNNAGAVYSYDTGDENGWNNINFGFGYNRLQDFNYHSTYSGTTGTSIADYFKERANTTTSDPFAADLAIGTGLVYQPSSGSAYISNMDSARIKYGAKNARIVQNRTMTSSGGMGDVNFAFGGNYKNKLYLGMSFNVVTLNYSEQVTIKESDANGNIPNFQSLQYNQQLSTSGTGYNLKVGAIYRITDWVRIGGYVHTPSLLNLTDNYTSDLTTNYKHNIAIGGDTTNSFSSQSPAGNFSYQIITPARFGGSLAFIVQKKGILSADVEYLDYSSAHINSDQESFGDVNTAIKNSYRGAYNFRLGGEYKVDKVFSVRAGYAYYQSPFKSGVLPDNINANTISYTAGVGIRGEGYFLDFAYIYTQQGQYIQPYTLSSSSNLTVDGASVKNTTQNFVLTLGFKF